MPDRLSMHAAVLVNTVGHSAGAIVFGILLYFFLIDWRRDPHERGGLSCVAASLALLWNVGSLIGLATAPGDAFADVMVAGSFSVLSFLPAVLMHLSLGPRRRTLLISGYVISSLAVLLHGADLITDAPRFHYAAILLITIGFGILAVVALGLELGGRETNGSGKRLAASLGLLLLAISFAHFRADHDSGGWSGEAALHHAALPLALFVLLQDYRFLLLDAFVRFLANAVLAAGTVWVALKLQDRFALLPSMGRPFNLGLAFVGACLLISLFALLRGWTQRALTRVVFLRGSTEKSLAVLREIANEAKCDFEFLRKAIESLETTFSTNRAQVITEPAPEMSGLRRATPVADTPKYGCGVWVRVVVPIRLSRGDIHFLCLGARAGGRRYLSEDMDLLDRMTATISEQMERIRNTEMQDLVTRAELRALQAQINPHFLFNALNTLYGTIPRESATARRLVLNLADLFRVSFASERNSITIEEELKLVRAYLEIEQLRLGSRLTVEMDVDKSALQAEVPVLSIQPLVENAVKHGAAATAAGGFVRLRIHAWDKTVLVEVSNSGAFRPDPAETRGTGVGLANVERRLLLHFGEQGKLTVASENEWTTASFRVPLHAGVLAAPAVLTA